MTDAAGISFPERFPLLETERLVLRRLEVEDAGALFEIFADPETMRYWSSPPMADVAEAEALVARAHSAFSRRESLRWAVTCRGDNEVIGSVSLFALDPPNRRGEIGYLLAREHWGHGYNHEALVSVLEYSFGELGLNRLEADLDPLNAASVKAVARLGFVEEGLLRERWLVSGQVSDSLIAGLLRADWVAGVREGGQ